MSTTAKMEAPGKDNETIFSEFHDRERIALVNRILTTVGITKMPRGNVFLLWFSSMEHLQHTARELETCDPDSSSAPGPLYRIKVLRELALDVTAYWVRTGANPFPPTQSKKRAACEIDGNLPAKKERSGNLVHLCYARDRDECLVTKRSNPTLEAAHIVPFRLNQSESGRGSIFQFYFAEWWGSEWSDKWKRALSSDSSDSVINTEFLANMMTLSKQVHAYWGQAMCAFRPIEINEEKTKMRLGFHWLPLLPRSVKRNTIISATENPFDGDDRSYLLPTRKISLFNYETDKRIISGDVFTVKTDDPQNRPLPSWDLLLLMWHLTRIAAMQGAGEDTDDDEASSDDDLDQESDYVLC